MSRMITVQRGDTLSSLAAKHLGNAERWRELYARNKERIEAEQKRYPARKDMRGPDWIFEGMKLEIPN